MVKKQTYLFILLACLATIVIAFGLNYFKSSGFEKQSLNFKFNPRVHIDIFLEKNLDLANSGKTSVVGEAGFHPFELAANFLQAAVVDRTFPVTTEELELNISFKEWQIINQDRNKAQLKGVNRGARWVPISAVVDGKTFKADMRLKGNTGDHWFWPERWSFRIKLKNGATFRGMREFSIQRPGARQFPADYLFQKWHQSIGGLAPRFSFARVKINGESQGLMLIEEALGSHMIELAERKSGPVFKLISSASEGGYYFSANRRIQSNLLPETFYSTNSIELVQSRKHSVDERMMKLFSYAYKSIMGLDSDSFSAADVFDHRSMLKPLLLSQIWGTGHTLNTQNTRYYLNPYTLLIEPITTDQTRIKRISRINSRVLDRTLSENPIQSKIVKSILISAAQTMPEIKTWHHDVCMIFPVDCPSFDNSVINDNYRLLSEYVQNFSTQSIEPQSDKIITQKTTAPTTNQSDGINFVDYPEHLKAVHFNDGRLKIFNYLSTEVIIDSVEIECSKKEMAINPDNCDFQGFHGKLAASENKQNLSSIEIDINVKKLTKSKFVRIISSVNGQKKVVEVYTTIRDDIYNPINRNIYKLNISKYEAMVEKKGSTYLIRRGDWDIASPIVFPQNSDVTIEPGTSLRFAKDAYLIIRGALTAQGSQNLPIEFLPKGESWKGLYVLSAQRKSYLDNVKFQGMAGVEDAALILTGGVTFYKSDVSIQNSSFSDSFGEDALNIVESNFTISKSRFTRMFSDALDSDFSDGEVNKITFLDVKGDGLDLAGSKVSADGMFCKNIGDKCVSVGESSQFNAENIDVENALISIASKDGSTATVDRLQVNNKTRNRAMAYIKKDAYGPSRLSIVNTNLDPAQIFCMDGSRVEFNNKDCKPE